MKWLPLLLLVLPVSISTTAQDDQTYKQLSAQANNYYRHGNYKQAAETLESAIAIKGNKAGYIELFNAACAWSLAGYADNAFKNLYYLCSKNMVDPEGYLGKNNLDPLFYLSEKDLKPLHSDKRWDTLMNRLWGMRTPLVNLLDSIYLDDQQGRGRLKNTEEQYGLQSEELAALWDDIHKKDSINLIKVKTIIDKYGWPGEDSAGKRGNSTVFLVIQHSDLETQEHYLPVLREAVKEGKARGNQLAMLEDRILLAQGKRQLYGTQVGRIADGPWYLRPLEDPDNVNKRRHSAGLPDLYYYLRNWNINWNAEEYKQQLPHIEEIERKMKEEYEMNY